MKELEKIESRATTLRFNSFGTGDRQREQPLESDRGRFTWQGQLHPPHLPSSSSNLHFLLFHAPAF